MSLKRGDFIAETLNSGVLMKTVTILHTGINAGRAEFMVELDDDEIEESANGIVTATVQAGTGFVLGQFSQNCDGNDL